MKDFRQYKRKIEDFIGVSEGMKRVRPPRVELDEVEFDMHAIDEYLGFHPRKKLMKAIMAKVGKIEKPKEVNSS